MSTKSSFRSHTLEARTLLASMIQEVLERARWAPAQVDEALAALKLDRDAVRQFDVLFMREIVSLALQVLAEVPEPEQMGLQVVFGRRLRGLLMGRGIPLEDIEDALADFADLKRNPASLLQLQ